MILSATSDCKFSGADMHGDTTARIELLPVDRLPFDAPVELTVMFTARPTANPEVLTASGLG
jgi:hypothetical protein